MKIGLDPNQENDELDFDDDFDDIDIDDDDDSGDKVKKGTKKIDPKIIIIASLAVVVVIVLLVMVSMSSNSGGGGQSSAVESSLATDSPSTEGLETEMVETEGFEPGVIDYDSNENMKNSDTLDSPTDFLKDLNGISIPIDYNVESIDYVRDYVNYTKHRASIDDGMELYWIEISYKGKDYRCTIPFWRYKAMDDSGICITQIEVLTLEGGEKIISNMVVVDSIEE